MKCVREEHPRPQMVRPNWTNLNGVWDFTFDFGRTGMERELQNAKTLDKEIVVPFCPESILSGIGYTDIIPAVWYHKTFDITREAMSGRVLLHFEAVDYVCHVWINGQFAGRHEGGFTPFTFDITELVKEGENSVNVYAEDDIRNPLQPRGKQSERYASQGCDYTRVTGIWQTVWLEFVPEVYISAYRCTPDVDNQRIRLEVSLNNICKNGRIIAKASYDGRIVGEKEVPVYGKKAELDVTLDEMHLWQPLAAELYDLELVLKTGEENLDCVTGYFGMRSLVLTDNALLINGKPVFQRLVLDQGYYPDGIWTAPDEEALKKDIELSIALGFNGARMHQKVFERRYLYWADKLGYLIWGEYSSWGIDVTDSRVLEKYAIPWLESVERDYNSPALIGWCPLNETWDCDGRRQDDRLIQSIYRITKAADPTRPVIDTSGHYHVETDIFDVHDYEQDVEKFAEHYEEMKQGGAAYVTYPDRQRYHGQPYFVSEYGGLLWNETKEEGWGYGNAPKTVEEFTERYVGLAKVLLDNPHICALCYTQLYDVEQEKNGLYTYGRKPKFDETTMKRLHDAMAAKAAIEQ